MGLGDAVALHRQGRFAEAETAYRAVLAAVPREADAAMLLGVLALQTGRPLEAVALIGQAVALAPDRAPFHFNLGGALGQAGRPAEAIAAYDRALELQPDYPEAARGRATALIETGRLNEALATLDHALLLAPGHAETLGRRASVALALGDHAGSAAGFAVVLAAQPASPSMLMGHGLALAGMDRLTEALAAFDRVIALDPDMADAHANRGLTLYRLGRATEALVALDAALLLQRGHAMALDNRGNALRALGRLDEALASHDAAIGLCVAGSHLLASAHTGRGATLQAMHRYAEALDAHGQALALRPSDAEAHNNRGTAFQGLGRYEEARRAYDQALALRPDYAAALTNRGVLLQMTGDAAGALASFDAALGIRPDDPGFRFNASLCRLLLSDRLGNAEAGWRDFEYRWDTAFMAPERRDFRRPRWRGEALGSVLLHAEQGFGDTLQFCRYARMAADRGVEVVLEVQPALARLMRRLDPRITVFARGQMLPPFDWHCPLLSLPLTLGPGLGPSPRVYLQADPGRTAAWALRLAGFAGRKIGLVWAGSPRHHTPELQAADRRRSISLPRLAPLARAPGMTFVSLQKGEAAAQALAPPPGMALLDWTSELTDFDDTAALVAALDLVISVDTAAVHLAGGLGVPVWVLNRFDTCWRWHLGRTDSPWYPSATLFRQPVPGDWDSVIEAVADALGGANGQAV